MTTRSRSVMFAGLAVLAMSSAVFAQECPRFAAKFSIPVEPETSIGPGQYRDLEVPAGRQVLITDVYIHNLSGPGRGILQIMEQRSPTSFEVRYSFFVEPSQLTIVNYTSGLPLGEKTPIAGTIRIQNRHDATGSILPRINGCIVR